MLLNELLSEIPDSGFASHPDVEIRDITYDSRRAKDGDLFVAIRGQKTDGSAFVAQAAARGAVAAAMEQEPEAPAGIPIVRVKDAREFLARAARVLFHDPAARLRLAAVTGTNGKTTTTYLLESVFREAGYRALLVGTTGMRIGNQEVPSERTTPEAADLMRFLQKAIQGGCTHGALEVSSHALVLKRVFGTHFEVGVFTNLTQDHLDFHGDMESYYRAKKTLFMPEGDNAIRTAVVNSDDPYGRRLASEIGVRVVRAGFGEDADIRVVHSDYGVDGTNVEVATPAGSTAIRLRLLGRPNVYNALSTVGAALGLGFGLDVIRRGIEALPGVPGRMEPVHAGQRFLVLVDYAHTPDALEKMLATALTLPHGRLITVFGCGGDRDRGKRPLMGEIAARMSDHVVATSDNPRSEDPQKILAEIAIGLKKGESSFELVPDRREAIGIAVARAGPEDVVVIAGKGHEAYQVIGDRAFPFDDRSVAREMILRLTGAQANRN